MERRVASGAELAQEESLVAEELPKVRGKGTDESASFCILARGGYSVLCACVADEKEIDFVAD